MDISKSSVEFFCIGFALIYVVASGANNVQAQQQGGSGNKRYIELCVESDGTTACEKVDMNNPSSMQKEADKLTRELMKEDGENSLPSDKKIEEGK